MNSHEFLPIFLLISSILISTLVIRKTTSYKIYAKKKETNQISKKIIYAFTKKEDCNLSEMIEYHKKNGCQKYDV